MKDQRRERRTRGSGKLGVWCDARQAGDRQCLEGFAGDEVLDVGVCVKREKERHQRRERERQAAVSDSVSGAVQGRLGTDQCLEGFAGHDEVLDEGMLYKHSVQHWLQTGIAQLSIDSSQLVLWKTTKTHNVLNIFGYVVQNVINAWYSKSAYVV